MFHFWTTLTLHTSCLRDSELLCYPLNYFALTSLWLKDSELLFLFLNHSHLQNSCLRDRELLFYPLNYFSHTRIMLEGVWNITLYPNPLSINNLGPFASYLVWHTGRTKNRLMRSNIYQIWVSTPCPMYYRTWIIKHVPYNQ